MNVAFEWTPDISVGDEVLDNQHKKLLGKVNELFSAILEGQEKEVVADIIKFLDMYVGEHLVAEEEYMRVHAYPEINEHILLHKEFTEAYDRFKDRLHAIGPDTKLAADVEQYIGNWWIHHIGQEDKKYADFIKNLG